MDSKIIWKQITTDYFANDFHFSCVYQRSKSKSQKGFGYIKNVHKRWANIIISKIESKSQPTSFRFQTEHSCGKYHYFKDRKQITTPGFVFFLDTVSIDQNTLFEKQITTFSRYYFSDSGVLSCGKIYIFESKSQRCLLSVRNDNLGVYQ